jgi:two-component system chemotaxis response regulator CheB
MRKNIDIVAIGGSSGSLQILIEMISRLPDEFAIPLLIVIHRMKNVESQLKTMLSSIKKIREPEDKEVIRPGFIYLAPQNYHLLIEEDRTFSLDYSELVNYSRPSIDVTFISASEVYRQTTMGILLSGANRDGAQGINKIVQNGGIGMAQDPATAECPVMPESAISSNPDVMVLSPENIIKTIINLLS